MSPTKHVQLPDVVSYRLFLVLDSPSEFNELFSPEPLYFLVNWLVRCGNNSSLLKNKEERLLLTVSWALVLPSLLA